jgi:hypothetical protein
VVAKANDAFSKDISVKIFGNPLIQVGDIITLSYSLKNIKNLTYFVNSVTQTFNQGLQTTLVMNQISYSGSSSIYSPDPNYPTLSAVQASSSALVITPNIGSTAGGDLINISGGTGWSGTSPVVYFGKISDNIFATNVTVINDTTLTCVTPPYSNATTVPVYVVSNGITSSTSQYSAYTYSATATVSLNQIPASSISHVDVQQSNKTYSLYISWTPASSNENAFSWTGSGGSYSGGANNVIENINNFFEIVIDGLSANTVYNFTITPLDIQNGIVIGSGTPTTFSHKTGTTSTGLQSPPIITASGTIISATGEVDLVVQTDPGGGAPDVFAYYWYNAPNGASGNGTLMFNELLTSPTEKYTKASSGWSVDIYGGNYYGSSSPITLNYDNLPVDAVLGPPVASGPPYTPTIFNDFYNVTTGTIDLLVEKTNDAYTPDTYVITLQPARNGSNNETLSYPVSSLPLSNGYYLISIGNVKTNVTYNYSAVAKNSSGSSSPWQGGLTTGNSTYPVLSAPTLSNSVTVSWVGNAAYFAYGLVIYSKTNPGKFINWYYSFNFNNAGGQSAKTGGQNFLDNYYNTGTYFSPGEIIYAEIIPMFFGSGVMPIAGTPAISADYTVPNGTGGGGFITPVGKSPTVTAYNHHYYTNGTAYPATGGCWVWTDSPVYNPTGSVASWNWVWEYYSGKTSASGSPTSTGVMTPGSPTIPSLKDFYVTTGNTGNEYLRVRAVITGTDLNTYYGPWGGASGVFT